MNLISLKEILNESGMETGMKTNIQDLVSEHPCLPISCLHVNIIINSQVLPLKDFSDLKVEGK